MYLIGSAPKLINYFLRLYDKTYGKEKKSNRPRKKIAHIPILIHKEIMSNLVRKFLREFEQTSLHRFRRSNDMQFAFSYFQFILEEGKWPYEIDETDETWYYVGLENILNLKERLKYIKKRPKKFLCLNDNIDYTNATNAHLLIQLINEFFVQLFPKKSRFEI